MNLKDAFRTQNKLQALMDEAICILKDWDNILKVTTTHLRSKVMPEAQDAVAEDTAPSEYAEHINQVAAFLMVMLAEREKLSKWQRPQNFSCKFSHWYQNSTYLHKILCGLAESS